MKRTFRSLRKHKHKESIKRTPETKEKYKGSRYDFKNKVNRQKFLLATLENTHTDRKKASSGEVLLWWEGPWWHIGNSFRIRISLFIFSCKHVCGLYMKQPQVCEISTPYTWYIFHEQILKVLQSKMTINLLIRHRAMLHSNGSSKKTPKYLWCVLEKLYFLVRRMGIIEHRGDVISAGLNMRVNKTLTELLSQRPFPTISKKEFHGQGRWSCFNHKLSIQSVVVDIHSVPLIPALFVGHPDSQHLPVICSLIVTWQVSCLLLIVACFLCSHIYVVSPLLHHQADSYHRCQNVATVVSL